MLFLLCYIKTGYVLHENNHDCKEGGCKHEITSPSGEMSSPHYPDYYPAKKDCVWIFTTTPGHRIKLVFTSFEMEPHQVELQHSLWLLLLVQSGNSVGMCLWSHCGIWWSHDRCPDSGQVLWLEVAPPCGCLRQPDVAGFQIWCFSAKKGVSG